MFEIILNFIVSIPILFSIVFLLALCLTWVLNPTSTLNEIFAHWEKTWKGK